MDKHELPVFDWQSIINHHVHPFAELPELQHRAIINYSDLYKVHGKGKKPRDNIQVPESGKFQHNHLGRTDRVEQPDEEASRSG